MVMPAVNRRRTAREVRELIEQNPLVTPRYELVDGELLVTPSPNHRHQEAVGILYVALRAYLNGERVGRVSTSPSDVELEPEFLSQPDLYVVSTDQWRRLDTDRVTRTLMLAVEVLSPSSVRHDRVRKRPMYRRHVPDYWIIDLGARQVERWRPGDVTATILTDTLEWHAAGASEPFRLDLPGYFAQIFDDG